MVSLLQTQQLLAKIWLAGFNILRSLKATKGFWENWLRFTASYLQSVWRFKPSPGGWFFRDQSLD